MKIARVASFRVTIALLFLPPRFHQGFFTMLAAYARHDEHIGVMAIEPTVGNWLERIAQTFSEKRFGKHIAVTVDCECGKSGTGESGLQILRKGPWTFEDSTTEHSN